MLSFARRFWSDGCLRIAGVDEAGRGPLAGPVYAAAVVFDRGFLESELDGLLGGLTDSKKLSAPRRESFHDILNSSPSVDIGVGIADVAEIDELNILRATHRAMARAVDALSHPPDKVLVDGLPVHGVHRNCLAIVKGDSKSVSIAAASIVAKVRRDAVMRQLDISYPGFGFARHKGYGTRAHIQALREHGPCPEHRRSFRPVREAMERRGLPDLFD